MNNLKKLALSLVFSTSFLVTACSTSTPQSPSENKGFTVKGYGTPQIASWYNSGSRTIFVVTDAYNPRVYLAAKGYFSNKCENTVKQMDFVPERNLDYNLKAQLNVVAAGKFPLSGFAGASASATMKYPAVYKYNYTAFTKELHYNIVVNNSNNRLFSSGWLPDAGGGCTYKVF